MLTMSIFGAAVLHLAAGDFTQLFQVQEPETGCGAGEIQLDEAECKEYAKSDDAGLSAGEKCGSSTEGDDSSFTDLCKSKKGETQCAKAPTGCLRFKENGKT